MIKKLLSDIFFAFDGKKRISGVVIAWIVGLLVRFCEGSPVCGAVPEGELIEVLTWAAAILLTWGSLAAVSKPKE